MGSKIQIEKFLFALTLIALSFSLTYFTVFAGRRERFPVIRKSNIIQVTAIECTDLDKSVSSFSVCSLKPINRTLKLISARVVIHKPPVTNSSLRFTVLKKGNDYKPFGIDVYLDFCKYMGGKRNLVFDWFFKIVEPYSNINHTCPYSDDVIVENIPVMNVPLPSIFPDGRFRVDLQIYAYNKPLHTVKVYVDVVEK